MVASIEIWNEGFNLFETDPREIVGEYTVKSDSTGTLSDFTYKKKIVINTSGSNLPENYQVKITVPYNSEMQSSFEDIRFNTEAEEYINYWIESHTDLDTADVWLKLPDAVIDPGNDTIWMYYGNNELSDGGDGDNTFNFFDDFETTLDKWTIASGTPSIVDGELLIDDADTSMYSSLSIPDINMILEYDLHTPYTLNTSVHVALTNTIYYQAPGDDEAAGMVFWDSIGAVNRIYGQTFHNATLTQTLHTGMDTEIHSYKTEAVLSTSVKHYRDDILLSSLVSNFPDSLTMVHIGNRPGDPGDAYIDNIHVRKYITNEPTISFTTSGVVTSHTNITVDVTGTPFTIDEYIGCSIKFTDGALDENGYVITSNDTNTITCSAANFSTLSDGENFKIITTGKNLSSTGAPVTETTILSEVVQTLTQSYNYGFDDLFTLDATNSPVTETTILSEVVQTLTQSYNYGFDDLFTLELIYIISGNVKDNVGHNLPDVNITFENDVSYDTTTDSDGNYTQTVDAGVYDVTSSVLGGGLISETESVNADDLFKTQDFVLDRTTSQNKGVLLTDRNLLQKDN